MDESASGKIREQALKIAQSKDLDLLLAELKGDKTDGLFVSVAEDNQLQKTPSEGSEFITPLDEVQNSTSQANKDLKAKLFKQHIELCKVRE
jgi:hypothetical protein